MENFFFQTIENSKLAIRYWWMFSLLGALIFLCGILIFIFPTRSYDGLSLIFGLLVLLSGFTLILVSTSNRHYITSRGWVIVGGLIEIILGFVLCFNPSFTAGVLPYFLGFWLMFRSFSMLGMGFDMLSVKIKGAASTIFFGFLALIASVIILFQPQNVGSSAVIIWVALSFLFAGVSLMMFSQQLRRFHLAFR